MFINYKHPLCGTHVHTRKYINPIPKGASGTIHGVSEHVTGTYFYITWDRQYAGIEKGGWDSDRFVFTSGIEALDALPLAST